MKFNLQYGMHCASRNDLRRLILITVFLNACVIAAKAASTAPLVLYTDALSGPTSGGENNKGAYLSIFGKNFGSSGLGTTTKVYVGGTEVDNYRYLGPSKVYAKLAIQQITVQVGSLGGAAAGSHLPVTVVVGGVTSNADQTFIPAPGRIWFVSLSSGNDATAAAGDITKPFRNLQNTTTGVGVYFSLAAGDHIILRGGNWSDATGADTTWMKFGCSPSNCAPTAVNGTATAWIHITAYPGPVNGNAIETVHYTAPAGTSGGIDGPWSAITGMSGNYISVSNLQMETAAGANRDAAPINSQYNTEPWHVVNNELGPWVAGNSAILNAAGMTGEGDGVMVLGNHIHDIEGTSALQNHGIYAGTGALNWTVAYNWIHDVTGGSLVQFNDSNGGGGTLQIPSGTWQGFTGMKVHHNWLENAAKYGIVFNDQGGTNLGAYDGKIWDNVIIGTKLYPLRLTSTSPLQTMWYAYNTIYDCMTGTSGVYAIVEDEGVTVGAGIQNKYYDNIFAFGPHTHAGTEWKVDYSQNATASTFDFKRNLYFSNGQSPSAPSTLGDTSAVIGDPLFVSASPYDVSLQATSPAVHAATQTLPAGFTVIDDFTNLITRPAAPSNSIGAYELSGSTNAATPQTPKGYFLR